MNPVSGREWRLGIALLVFCQSDCLRGWSWKIEQKLINLTRFCKRILKFYLNWRFLHWINEERDWTTNSEGEIHANLIPLKQPGQVSISLTEEAIPMEMKRSLQMADTQQQKSFWEVELEPKSSGNIWNTLKQTDLPFFVLHLSFPSRRTPLAILGASPVCTCLQGCGADPGDWTKAHPGREQQQGTTQKVTW